MIDYWEIIAPILATLILSALGLPQKIWSKTKTWYRRNQLKKCLASGLYDDDTIEAAVRFYVRPKYASVDPAEYQEPVDSLLNARADLFSAMDSFLKSRSSDTKYLFVLADSGMGKTSFLINYFHHNYTRLFLWRRDMLLVSLALSDPEQILGKFDYSTRKSTDLMLDAFDEDTSAIGRAKERLHEILKLVEGFRTVTVSCRTQFFLTEESIPFETDVAKIGVVALGESKFYKFAKMYISPFDDEQVRKYLRYRYPGVWQFRSRKRAQEIVKQVPSLSVRPMLLAHVPELIGTRRTIKSAIDVYDAMIEAWAGRESKWIESHELLRLSKALALDFYSKRIARGGEFADPQEIISIAQTINVRAINDHITSRSLLNRNAAGKFKFAHRSILEYFLADWILNDGGGHGIEITDQIAKFIAQRLGSSSPEVEVFLTSCSIDVQMEAPNLTLGHPTNYALFSDFESHIDKDGLLKLQATLSNNSKGMSIGQHIFAFSIASPYADENRISRVRMVCRGIGQSDANAMLHTTVWFGGIAVCHTLKVSAKELNTCLGGGDYLESEFALVGEAPRFVVNLNAFSWSLEKRSFVVSSEAKRAGNLSAMHNNMSVSFEYNDNSNRLLVRMIQGTLNANGPLAEFGILSDAASVEDQAGFFVVKPITLDTSWKMLR